MSNNNPPRSGENKEHQEVLSIDIKDHKSACIVLGIHPNRITKDTSPSELKKTFERRLKRLDVEGETLTASEQELKNKIQEAYMFLSKEREQESQALEEEISVVSEEKQDEPPVTPPQGATQEDPQVKSPTPKEAQPIGTNLIRLNDLKQNNQSPRNEEEEARAERQRAWEAEKERLRSIIDGKKPQKQKEENPKQEQERQEIPPEITSTDPFEILKLNPIKDLMEATPDGEIIAKDDIESIIKTAFRKRVMEYHPDKYSNANKDEKESIGRSVRKINEAYEQLSNSESFRILMTAYLGKLHRSKKNRSKPEGEPEANKDSANKGADFEVGGDGKTKNNADTEDARRKAEELERKQKEKEEEDRKKAEKEAREAKEAQEKAERELKEKIEKEVTLGKDALDKALKEEIERIQNTKARHVEAVIGALRNTPVGAFETLVNRSKDELLDICFFAERRLGTLYREKEVIVTDLSKDAKDALPLKEHKDTLQESLEEEKKKFTSFFDKAIKDNKEIQSSVDRMQAMLASHGLANRTAERAVEDRKRQAERDARDKESLEREQKRRLERVVGVGNDYAYTFGQGLEDSEGARERVRELRNEYAEGLVQTFKKDALKVKEKNTSFAIPFIPDIADKAIANAFLQHEEKKGRAEYIPSDDYALSDETAKLLMSRMYETRDAHQQLTDEEYEKQKKLMIQMLVEAEQKAIARYADKQKAADVADGVGEKIADLPLKASEATVNVRNRIRRENPQDRPILQPILPRRYEQSNDALKKMADRVETLEKKSKDSREWRKAIRYGRKLMSFIAPEELRKDYESEDSQPPTPIPPPPVPPPPRPPSRSQTVPVPPTPPPTTIPPAYRPPVPPSPRAPSRAPQTSQVLEAKIDDLIEKYLSYQDSSLSRKEKDKAFEKSKTNDSARKYGRALQEIIDQMGAPSVEGLAKYLRRNFESDMKRIDIPVGTFGKSITWAMWDIAKQYYFFTHPSEGMPGYDIGNPMTSSEKREEIIDRHVGYEVWDAFFLANGQGERNVILDKIKKAVSSPSKYNEAHNLLLKTPTPPNDQLSSKDFAVLGRILRGR